MKTYIDSAFLVRSKLDEIPATIRDDVLFLCLAVERLYSDPVDMTQHDELGRVVMPDETREKAT
jgi:hypothetical protein